MKNIVLSIFVALGLSAASVAFADDLKADCPKPSGLDTQKIDQANANEAELKKENEKQDSKAETRRPFHFTGHSERF